MTAGSIGSMPACGPRDQSSNPPPAGKSYKGDETTTNFAEKLENFEKLFEEEEAYPVVDGLSVTLKFWSSTQYQNQCQIPE